jgi:hypothetical protein
MSQNKIALPSDKNKNAEVVIFPKVKILKEAH